VRRVATATHLLESSDLQHGRPNLEKDIEAAMRKLGDLSNQSHESLRDLYDVSTPEVERLVGIIRGDTNVHGARLMGGGFGGNVLALTNEENVAALVARVQNEYYQPQNRQGVSEGSVMVSTPGDGLAPIDVESVWREAIEDFNASGREATKYWTRVNELLDSISTHQSLGEVWPVIVAAGKGTRSLASGLALPKPLAPVLGMPSVLHVLRNVRTAFEHVRRPIVIVSPQIEAQTRALIKEDVTLVVQPDALGTGDAVLCAHEQMGDFEGRVLVIWATQPVVRPETMRRTLKLAALFADYEMVLPTAHKDRPYAPLLRDDSGRVQTARETHLEQFDNLQFGETNIGMFMLKSQAMFNALIDLKQRHWDEMEQRYKRKGGELGFPNELINYFAPRATGVFASPIADSREEQGIKKLDDIVLCERFISELA
jgi:CTP:molybdopterin cytidylyltransferase MocA